MASKPSVLDSLIAQIPAMGNAFSTTSRDENVYDRALVICQPLVNQPNDDSDTAANQDGNGRSASQPEDLLDISAANDDDERDPITKFEDPSTMNKIKILDDVSQFTAERSSILLVFFSESFIHIALLTNNSPQSTVIEVVVEEKSTLIAKHLLCSHSSFFERALNGSFREAHDNRIILDECYEVFQIFHTWLLEGKLDFVEPDSNSSLDGYVAQRQLVLLEVYIFAERLGIPKLYDDALLQLDKLLRPSGRPGRASVDCIYNASEFLPESSDLWRYLIALEKDANLCRSPRRALADLVDLPNSFLVETRPWTAEESNAYVRIGSQPLNLFTLSKHVCEYGGYGKVEQLRKWGVICMKMGISLSFQSKIFLQVREAYAYWLGPFDDEFTSEERLVLEKRCSRPFVKQFFQAPVAPAADAMARMRIRNSNDL